jgi:hypothetical protein
LAPAREIFRRCQTCQNTGNTVDFSLIYLKQVVTIHQAMFERLLFDENAAVSLELAELFQDAGRTYLQISERINLRCLAHHSLQD